MRSLTSSEHFALNVLNNYRDFIENCLSNKLVNSAPMIGNTAPDILFCLSGDIFAPGYTTENKSQKLQASIVVNPDYSRKVYLY